MNNASLHHIFLALGSNVGDTRQNLARAQELLSEKITIVKCAPLYETSPVGYTKQDNFLNTVIEGETALSPEDLLVFVKGVEKKIGRVTRFRWGPREIDIDILFYDDLVYKQGSLEIPHPRLHERDFVLVPMQDIAPNYVHPVLQKTVRELLEALPPDKKSVLHIVA